MPDHDRPAGSPRGYRMQTGRVPGPQALVIFGATGDLARRKLVPALYRLFCEGLLPERFVLLGMALHPLSDAEFRDRVRTAAAEAECDTARWDEFAERLFYSSGDFTDPGAYVRLGERLAELDAAHDLGGNRLFYLAIPPQLIQPVAEQLGRAGLARRADRPGSTRVVVEKPFGRDLDSARELNAALLRVFEERQVYRIDHYLGKETVQNLLVFRFANVIWEPVWNRTYVDHVQITVGESLGVGTRAGYYEGTGALRDMVQSHLLQLLALVAMEPPAQYDADSIRDEKSKLLSSVRPLEPEQIARDTVRGRYTEGVLDGERVPGYREEPRVAADSQTETFAAVRLSIDNWRWAGVPFYLRTGKRLPERVSEIVIRFRCAPHPILDVVEGDAPAPNHLVLRIQPEAGIALRFEAKVPGLAGPLRPVRMHFDYEQAFGVRSPAAYERLLLDAMLGDPTLFARQDETERAWAIVSPVLDAWADGGEPPLLPYPAGTWGPSAAARLIGEGGWHQPEP